MTGLSVYKMLFMTELLVAEILFTKGMKRRKYFAARAAGSLLTCYLAAFFYPSMPGGGNSWWYASLMFLALFAITYLSIVFTFDTGFGTALFCAVSAYTVQHLAYGLVSVLFALVGNIDFSTMYTSSILSFSKIDEGTVMDVLGYLNIYVFVYCLSYIFLSPKFKNVESLKIKNFKILFIAAFFLLVDIVLNAIVVYDGTKGTLEYVSYAYNFICCMLIFYMQLSIVSEKMTNNQLESVSEALRQSHKQYKLQKESINLINMKCHDLKHQISLFATGKMDVGTVREIENMISIYDATVKTGNDVLDIILTQKSLSCNDKRIKLACMVSFSDFGKISEGDLYALFGNILDNSIEAVNKISDEDKRCITLDVHSVNRFACVKVENYFDGEIRFDEDGMPETSKRDKRFHGFGMRSIAAITEKYGGTLSVSAKDGVFTLVIMFPLSVGNKAKTKNQPDEKE